MSGTWRTGACHCGRVRFAVRLDEAPALLSCNCSICALDGFLHLIVAAPDLRIESGQESLQEYRFGTRTARHLFCRHCGTKPFYVPRSHPDGFSVNARCLAGGPDPAWQVAPFDGRNWEASRERLDGGATPAQFR